MLKVESELYIDIAYIRLWNLIFIIGMEM